MPWVRHSRENLRELSVATGVKSWIDFRQRLISEPLERLDPAACLHSAADWSYEQWWALYQPWREFMALDAVRRTLDRRIREWPVEFRPLCESVRSARNGQIPMSSSDADIASSPTWDAWPLDSKWAAWWHWEFDLERLFWKARGGLRRGECDGAARDLGRLTKALDEAPAVVGATWRPAIRYWCGVVLARRGDPGATDEFRQLRGSPLSGPAAAQLALLALQAGDLARCAAQLAEVETAAVCPPVLYAQALLDLRQQNADRAAAHLLRLSEIDPHERSYFTRAAHRVRERIPALRAPSSGHS